MWFGYRERVSRRDYLVTGVVLMVVKYLGETALLWRLTGAMLSPLQFIDPMVTHRAELYGDVGAWVVLAWTLPFIWIGLNMSMRRAIDAGYPSWNGALFLLPVFNWLVMVLLAAAPRSEPAGRGDVEQPPDHRLPRFAAALLAMLASGAVAGGMLLLGVYALRTYGMALFVFTPVAMGVVSAGIARRTGDIGIGGAIAIGQAALVLCLLVMIGVAVEGAMCVAMAWPIAAFLMLIGSALGWALCSGGRAGGLRSRGTLLLPLLLLPTIAWQETRHQPALLREVRSSVEVAAPPAAVWERVVSFPDLPKPDGIFALGIACPLRARIVGSGVGAIRYYEFTTGPFVEPITVWEPGSRLAFDVVAQPPAMKELSPWPEVRAPHLDGYLASRRGEFRLIALPAGRTRLEGSTWYQVDVRPEAYWSLWSEAFIHAIHRRVLRHIASLAEADAALSSPIAGSTGP